MRSEISKKNPYWIPKHRYLELKHFCLQYPDWKKQVRDIAFLSRGMGIVRTDPEWSDPTPNLVHICEAANRKIKLVEDCARIASEELASYILKSVTEEASFVQLRMVDEIPCSRDKFYDRRRRFYYILDLKS